MPTTIFATASAMLVAAGLLAAPAAGVTSTQQQIVAAEHRYTYGILHRDTKVLSRVFADSFIDTGANGTVQTKQQLLHAIAVNPAPDSITESDRVIHTYGGATAVVSVEFVAKGRSDGKPYTYRGRATDVWVLIGGRWQCVAAHSSQIQ